MNGNASSNYEVFRDCLSGPIIEKSAITPTKPRKRKTSKGRKTAVKTGQHPDHNEDEQHSDGDNPEDLADFIDYLATEIFTALPDDLRTLTHTTLQATPSLTTKYALPLPQPTLTSLLLTVPASVPDSLTSYALLPSSDDPSSTSLATFLAPILTAYISTITTPPPPWPSTRTPHCEICLRDWIPLTYHHLIPKSTHAKALKRGWHEEWRLNSVAWLCRACHSFVHGIASNEVLAREWWSVELLLGREDVRAWRGWVGRVRWKKR
ncbi:hypothetical protein MMC16_006297 [Acarospora aff. strigata]|nr:hypothetical protein [Acarospora aff. strigata]